LLAVDLDFSALFSQDSIRNRSGGSDDLLDSSIDGCCRLVTDAYAQNQSDSGNGLKDNGAFAANAFHPPVQLGYNNNDNGDNVVFLPDTNNSVTVDVAASLVTRLHLFALSANGASNMQVTLTYADGLDVLTTQVADWFDEVKDREVNGDAIRYHLIDGMDRVDDGFRIGFHDASDPAVFGHVFDVNPQRGLQSFTITNVNTESGTPNLVVLGATMDLVIAPISFAKSFDPPVIGAGSVSTLTFDILNEDEANGVGELAFVDVLPAGVSIAAPARATSACDGILFSVTVEVPATIPLATTVTNTTSSVTGKINGLDVSGAAATDSFLVEMFATTRFDFGDAPTAIDTGFTSSYPVTLAQNGARHSGGPLILGQKIDPEDGCGRQRRGCSQWGDRIVPCARFVIEPT